MLRASKPLRILVVSFRFPPAQSIGAIRVGAVASELTKLGHEVHVLTVTTDVDADGAQPERAPASVTRTRWIGPTRPAKASAQRQRRSLQAVEAGLAPPDRSKAFRIVRWVRRNLVWLPDDYFGWAPFAVAEGVRLCRRHQFDLIFASAWPVTSLIAGAMIARHAHLPWVAELRDLWTGHHYSTPRAHQRGLDRLVEARVLGSTAGLVTVSDSLARGLRREFAKPSLGLYTGFSPRTQDDAPRAEERDLVIAYTGQLYQGKRDPSPLLEAVRMLGGDQSGIRVVVAGPDNASVLSMARSSGLESSVVVFPQLSHAQAVALQRRADVLLLLLWNTPFETGVVTGKLFEYLSHDKPVLVIGAPPDSEAVQLVEEHHLGRAGNQPEEIAEHLEAWRAEKAARGVVSQPDGADKRDLTREAQAKRLETYLYRLLGRE